MSDFDLGYYYYLHDKHQEEKVTAESGENLMSTGTLLIIISIILAIILKASEILLLAIVGSGMIISGTLKRSKFSPGEELSKEHQYDVELHHQDIKPHQYPSIIRQKIAIPFSELVGQQHKERSTISEIIKRHSGKSINAIFNVYKDEGGTYDAEHFVKAVHTLNRHGIVKVRKSIYQAPA